MLPIPFWNPYTYPGHSGVDFPQSRGTLFRASGPGYVSSIDYGQRPGHTVWVKYDNGPNVGYCHMDSRTTDVHLWQRVVEGTILGRVGSLGRFSTGPHLHVEVSGHATTAGFWKFFTPYRVVSASGGGAGGGGTPLPPPVSKDWFDMATEADLKRVVESVTRDIVREELRNAIAPLIAAGSGRFYKHGETGPGRHLWFWLMENGDFIRIRDLKTGRKYKALNGGQNAVVLPGETMRMLAANLVAAGGRDLSEAPDGTVTPTHPDQAVTDAMLTLE